MAIRFRSYKILRMLLVGCMLVCTHAVRSQFYFVNPDNFYNVGFSSLGNRNTISVSWQHMHILDGKDKALKIGYGIRYSSFFGAYGDFTSALSSFGTTPDDIDTVAFENYRIHSLNLSFYASFAITKRLEVELNIDAFGLAYSNPIDGYYNTLKRKLYTGEGLFQRAQAPRYNVLLGGANDRGSLNSELVIRYWFRRKMGFKVGIAHMANEMVTDNKLYNGVNRFKITPTMIAVGFTYSPYRL
ncbi:MAG: hypothetical protein ACK45I_00695 [Bacteroidota bacterium]|jgi:hypothetical protein